MQSIFIAWLCRARLRLSLSSTTNQHTSLCGVQFFMNLCGLVCSFSGQYTNSTLKHFLFYFVVLAGRGSIVLVLSVFQVI